LRTDEQEKLINSIRSGTVVSKNITIVPATLDQISLASNVYSESFSNCLDEGLMTEESLERWMLENHILPSSFYSIKKILIEKIDSLKKDLFFNRKSKSSIKLLKQDLQKTRSSLSDLIKPKSDFITNTCEFIAQTKKIIFLLKNTTYKSGKLYRPANFQYIIDLWQNSLLSESTIRFLCRTAIWSSIWSNRGFGFDLFCVRKNTDLTINQRNMLTWSRVYDNINESLDCPLDFVIEDDDMLDGWLLIQKNKREKEAKERDKDDTGASSKFSKNHQHVFTYKDTEDSNDEFTSNTLEQNLGIKNE